MYRTELKNGTLIAVTNNITKKENERQKALQESANELEMDKKKIHEFVNESNLRKGEKERYER